MDEEEYEPIASLTSDELDWFAIEMTTDTGESMLTATTSESEAEGLLSRMIHDFPDYGFKIIPVTGIFMDNTRYDKMAKLTWYGVTPLRRRDNYITQIFSTFKDLNDFLEQNRAEKYRFISLIPK
jgi:hypothetical protein